MRHSEWVNFSHLTMGEVASFLSWLDQQPCGRATIDPQDPHGPLGSEKILEMSKVLVALKFSFVRPDCIKIRHEGCRFVAADFSLKMALLREHLWQLEPTSTIMALLGQSSRGRLSKTVLIRCFQIAEGSVDDLALKGFLDWARMCELFHYDKNTDEIVAIPRRMPLSMAL